MFDVWIYLFYRISMTIKTHIYSYCKFMCWYKPLRKHKQHPRIIAVTVARASTCKFVSLTQLFFSLFLGPFHNFLYFTSFWKNWEQALSSSTELMPTPLYKVPNPWQCVRYCACDTKLNSKFMMLM